MSYININAHPVQAIQPEEKDHALEDTIYLKKSPNNAARLAEAIDEIEALIACDTEGC